MSILRNCLLAAAMVLVGAAALVTPLSNGLLERRTGCESVVIGDVLDGTRVVLEVRVSGCRTQDSNAVVSERVVRAVWTSLTKPADEVRLTIEAGHAHIASTEVFKQPELVSRFAAKPLGVAWSTVRPGAASDQIWVILPLAFAAAGCAAALLTSRMRRAGVALILLR